MKKERGFSFKAKGDFEEKNIRAYKKNTQDLKIQYQLYVMENPWDIQNNYW